MSRRHHAWLAALGLLACLALAVPACDSTSPSSSNPIAPMSVTVAPAPQADPSSTTVPTPTPAPPPEESAPTPAPVPVPTPVPAPTPEPAPPLEPTPAPAPPEELSGTSLQAVLDLVAEDEYRSLWLYRAVLARWQAKEPFAHIADVEAFSHLVTLNALYVKRFPEMPVSQFDFSGEVAAYEDFKAACAAAVQREQENQQLLDAQLDLTVPNDVKNVLTNLIEASAHHESAFSKCAG